MKITFKHFSISLTSLLFAGCVGSSNINSDYIVTPSGLKYKVLIEGQGPEVKQGQTIKIHESTSYRDGTLIFSSEKMPPIEFVVGEKMVIQGVEEGVIGMKKGEHRKLIVPTSLSKRRSYPPILNKDSILVYHIELIDITN